jgi:endonuclease-8
MPEGDTILRAARSLERWLAGREVTAARSRTRKAPLERVVGRTVESVEARAKHLLITFTGGAVLHSHLGMTGSWHVYTRGERWRKPLWKMAAVLEAGARVAVCFDAPTVELLTERDVETHPSISGLGPDVLRPPVDMDEVRRRAAAQPEETPIGELLLDQRVVSGIGNIYRCETLFVCRTNPWLPHGAADLDALVAAATRLTSSGLRPQTGRHRMWVYDRAGRPCRRCGVAVAVERGDRSLWWCPSCQAAPSGSAAV